MLAVARQESSAIPAPRGVAWVDGNVWEERTGKTQQEFRRLCGTKWFRMGLAKMESPEGGGKARWLVREDADPRLSRCKRADEIAPDRDLLATLTDEQKVTLQADLELLKRAEAARALGVRTGIGGVQALKDFFARMEPGKGSYATFLRKWKEWRARGIAGIIDGRWQSKRDGDSADTHDKRMIFRAAEFYLDGSAPSKAECFRAAEQDAIKNGWALYRQRTVSGFLAKLPAAETAFNRYGRQKFDNLHGTYISRSYGSLKSNELWQSDHYHMDLVCQAGERINPRTGEVEPIYVRPWGTFWIDVPSRKILAALLRASSPDSGGVKYSYYLAAKENGHPETVYLDNGADYDHKDLRGRTKMERRKLRGKDSATLENPGIWARVGVKVINAQIKNAKAKLEERLHRTIKEQFCRTFDTYTGGNPQEKPERLEKMTAKGHVPTLEEVQAAFSAWMKMYNCSTHSGAGMDGMSPDECYARKLEKKRVASPELLQQLMLRRVGPVKVGRNGVRYHGLDFGQYDLGHLQTQEVFLAVDDQDMSKVTVWDVKGLFLALAHANQIIPANADRELLRAAINRQRQYNRALRNAQPARAAMHEDIPAMMFRLQKERAEALAAKRNLTPPASPTLVAIRSPVESQLKRVQEAIENAKPEKRAAAARERSKTWETMTAALNESWEKSRAEKEAEVEAK